jgi:SAM-dependent methyltransferase
VLEARKCGVSIYGADVFYSAHPSDKKQVEAAGLLNDSIREIKQDKIDFEDGKFDIVVCNMVFEHVENLDAALKEIHRVMSADAKMICLFPTKDVIREGHWGIPFVHWFSKGSRLRFYFVYLMRLLGFGYYKSGTSYSEYACDALHWLDKYTFYRDYEEIIRTFGKYYKVKRIEDDYVLFRLSKSRMKNLSKILVKLPGAKALLGVVMRKMAFVVLLAEKINITA